MWRYILQYNIFNTDCIKKMQSMPDNSIDLIVTDPPYNNENIENFYKGILTESKRLLTGEGTLWLFYNTEDIKEVLSLIKTNNFINHLENASVFSTPEKTFQAFHLTKSDKYIFNQIEIKREVAAPYVVKTTDGKSEKRGWDYENGKPMRWTGIGNCVYADNKNFLDQLLLVLSSNDSSKCILNGDNIIRNYDILFNQISSSENCKLHFNKRSFLPKEA